MASRIVDEPAAASARVEDAIDYVRFDAIGRLAGLAPSYWHSVELAADRGDTLTVAVHCKQVAAVTREAFALVGTLGSSGDAPP
jgi:hypothetical protein